VNFGLTGLAAELARLLLFVGLIVGAVYALRKRRAFTREPVADGPEDEPYRIHTTAYDLELNAAAVRTDLPKASPDAEKGWYQRDHALWLPCIPRVEGLLAEQDGPAWDEALARVESVAGGLPARNLAVSLLIDQSGSMKGARIAWAAALATRVVPLLSAIGARSEILGFTTAGWRGGHAYTDWKNSGRPPRPGRLCALMHVVYKTADEQALAEEARNIMLDPALLRENVDGEAILWARARLAARPEPLKLLIVISDGAPVDDATLMHNGPSYLWRHLMNVLGELASDPSLTLGGLGIGHSVEKWYANAAMIEGPEDLPAAAGELLEKMIAAAKGRN